MTKVAECPARECGGKVPAAIPLACRWHLSLLDMALIRELLQAVRSRRFQGEAQARIALDKARLHVRDTIEAGCYETYGQDDPESLYHYSERKIT